MSITITRRFEFDAGHRVHGHAGKCRCPHGHRYTLLLTMSAPRLNDLGMVADFGDIKSHVAEWIDRVCDHGFFVWCEDAELRELLAKLVDSKVCILDGNPTAEYLVVWMHTKLQIVLFDVFDDLTITHARLYETPNCWADSDCADAKIAEDLEKLHELRQ